ncbi:serine/threonine protein kinase [Micromonospora sp. KC207]|uniref:serine/threonine-protein kinase n=1 Tax=Micromonospora sp. KC207 TaxID=2530377 RepID=UPI00104B6B8E|nr:serine/threonine-protein kinase [Micromonospora sp. KC207]TDC67376.1 serine/threonine protein kinase [Micromonospora sp. KC207]
MSNALPQLVADRYRLISPLGQGGMGRVWKARDEVLHRDVAIKELVPPPSLTPEERREMRERSLREARAIARLNHVNVVRIFDVLRTDGDPWIVMEYVASKSLQDTLAEDGPVSPAKAVEIGLGVLGALKAAHKAGVMHRDIKPGNVLLGTDGRVVLTDFGLATIPGDPNVTRTGMVLGSPAYIAPERARDGTAGPEADLWSLGATLYAAVEGKSPYARPSAIATLAALATEPMPPPRNAGPLKPVLNGLLRKDPAERIDAEVAERLLRRAAGRRAKTISLLDGVRRPGPNGPREPRPPVVPAPRPAEQRTGRPAAPPAPRTPEGGLAAGGAAAAGVGGGDATAKVPAGVDAAPTAKVDLPSADADPTAKVTDFGPQAADTTAKIPAPDAATSADEDAGTPAGESDGPPADRAAEAADEGADGVPAAGRADDTRVDPGAAAPVSPPAPAREPAAAPREQAAPTSVLPAAAGPALSSTGRATVVGGTKPERRRRGLLVGALVAVLLIGLLAAVPLLGRSGDDDPGPGGDPQAGVSTSTPSAAPATSSAVPPSPTPSASPSVDPNALPEGWLLHKDPAGFSLPLPKGWVRRSVGQNTIVFDERDGVGELLVQWTSTPEGDAYADWKEKEPARKNYVNGYQYLSIKRCDYYKTCADWEWLENRDGTRIHVRNRGFVTASNRGYALRWEVANKDWQARLADFDRIAKGFKPDRVD